ncbi:hypothetical protein NE237_010646 [Protea cynaroides]|uniref:Uncharacterized protein n=1 Tax=Protea cynaroides TaxID=273540 RepID=A0A9Q0L106_9MAGN|nr:hypothetical protein NE237_010646 [Protea cynaroides]
MSTVKLEPLLHPCIRENVEIRSKSKKAKTSYLNYSLPKLAFNGGSFCNFKPRTVLAFRASSTDTATLETSEASEITFQNTFTLKRTQTVEGKVSLRLEQEKDEENWRLTVGCNLPGKWVLHWGVNYIDDVGRFGLLHRQCFFGSLIKFPRFMFNNEHHVLMRVFDEWDQPSPEMRPPGVPMKEEQREIFV